MMDLMINLETLSLEPNAAIISISAVFFDINTGDVGESFEIFLDIVEQVVNGSHISEDTCKWWSNQSAQAKSMLLGAKDAMHRFNKFIYDTIAGYVDVKDINLWGNGVSAYNAVTKSDTADALLAKYKGIPHAQV